MPWKSDLTKTDGTHETFAIPVADPQSWFKGSANSTLKSSMSTTSLEQIKKQAEAQAANTENKLAMFRLQDVRAGSHVPKDGK